MKRGRQHAKRPKGKHWSDMPIHETHRMSDEACIFCAMHKSWEGSRSTCTSPYGARELAAARAVREAREAAK